VSLHIRLTKLWFCVLALSLAAMATVARADGDVAPTLLAGNENVAYLVIPGTQDKTAVFQVLARRPGEPWKRLTTTPVQGSPRVVAAVEKDLHVFFAPLDYGTLSLSSETMAMQVAPPVSGTTKPSGPTWPNEALPLSACEAKGFAGVASPTLVAIVPLPQGAPATTSPNTTTAATKPAEMAWTATTQAGAVQPADLGVFQRVDATWFYRGKAATADLGRDTQISSASVDNTVYVLVHQGGADRPRNELYAMSAGGAATAVKLPADLQRAQCLAMLSLDKTVILVEAAMVTPEVTSAPTTASAPTLPTQAGNDHSLALWLYDSGSFKRNQVRIGDKIQTWHAQSLPQAARCGDYIELVWHDAGTMRSARLEPSGMMMAPTAIEVLSQMQAGLGQNVHRWYMIGVMAVSIILILLMRPTGPPKPFVLPEGVVAGNLGKRLVAVVIDAVPLIYLGLLCLGLDEAREGMQMIVQQGKWEATNAFWFGLVAGMTMLLVYSFVCELIWGATVGKMIMGLSVVGEDGRRPDWRAIALRNLIKLLELFWLMLPLVVIFPIITRYRQRLGDIFARTAVIDRSTEVLAPTPTTDENKPKE